MKRVLSLICVFALIFAVASCGGKKKSEKKEEKPAYEEQVTQEISAEEGGTVKNSDDSVSIEIPGGALDEDLTITMTIYDAQGYVGTEGQKVVSKVVEFEPSGTVFKKPVIIKMAATESFENQVLTAAVYRESKGEWSYDEHGVYAVLQGRDATGDPIMTSAAGDPIMLSAAGDPIMMSAAGDPIMMAAAGDPIMLASAGDPIMTSAAGDPIMNAAAGDPIMMTTGHFTAFTFIALEPGEPVETDDDEPAGNDDDEPAETDDDKPAETDDDEPVVEEDDDEPAETDDDEPVDDTDVPEPVDDDTTPAQPGIYSKVLCTGQVHCSDGNGSIIDCPAPGEYLYGQNGSYAGRKSCVPHKYTKIVPADEESPEGGEPTGGDQTPSYIQVVDESTGLRWALVYGSATWERAKTACEDLEYGGFEDWRLPSAKEWLSIADHDRLSPALRYFHFSKLEGSGYWTMTPVAENEDRYLIFGTDNATLSYDNASYAHYFVCVRGDEYGKAVEGSFSVLTQEGDEIVKDSATNLVWQKNYTAELNWKEALAYCASLNYAGYTDWRLPNKNELLSLVDYEKTTKPISMFPGDEGDYFWTSTFGYYYGGPDGALTINTEDGEISTADADEDGPFVRCVRSDTEPDTGIPLCDESHSAPCEDASTHYVWSQVDFIQADLSWKEKAVECRESKFGGISQWRIPTIDEIRTILTSSEKLKTGGECPVTDACSDFSAGCFDEEDEEKCIEEDGFETSLYDYGAYILSGTIEGEYEGVYYAWAVNTMDGSLTALSINNSDNYSVSRCIKDDSLPNPEFPYTDSASGLVWSERSASDLYWYEAAAYCQDLVEGGSNNWRVPTMEEVKTLVKNCPEGDCKPDTAGKYSALGELSTLWTSTVLTYESTSYLTELDFMTASQKSLDSAYTEEKVRCVRSVSDPANASEIQFPFEIYDLLWSKVSDDRTYYADDSQAYCDSLSAENYGGKNNWRVPEISEVALLIRKSVCPNKDDFITSEPTYRRCSGYSFDGFSIFGDMFRLKSSSKYYFDFARGLMDYSDYGYVRCVADLDEDGV